MNKTAIEWTDLSVNPLKYRDASGKAVWGCTKTSPGCGHCYSEAMARRFGRGGPFTVEAMRGLTPYLDEQELRRMLTCNPAAGKRCFVGDMTDVFGEWVPDELLDRLFAVFALRADVTWQVLTKRAERMRRYLATPGRNGCWGQPAYELAKAAGWITSPLDENWVPVRDRLIRPPLQNVWLGASIEDQQRADERIPHLLKAPAAVRFLACEPLLGPIEFSDVSRRSDAVSQLGKQALDGIDWVIVGGESGGDARPCHVAWIRSLVEQCKAVMVPCFVKQLGSDPVHGPGDGFPHVPGDVTRPKTTGDGYGTYHVALKDRKGGSPEEWPADLRVRQFPEVSCP